MILLASWGTINTRWRTRGNNTYHLILTVMDRQTGRLTDRQTDRFNSSPETASRAHVSQALQELEHVRGGVFPVAAHHSYAHSTAVGRRPKCIINLGPIPGMCVCGGKSKYEGGYYQED